MNENEKQKLATAVSQCKHHLYYGLSTDEFSPEVIKRAQKKLAESGGQYWHAKPNNNGHKEQLHIEFVNAPRGKSQRKNGNWLIPDSGAVILRIKKDYLEKIFKAENNLGAEELTNLREFKRRFESLSNLTDEQIKLLSTLASALFGHPAA